MKRDNGYLATGFRDVDGSRAAEVCSSCLKLLDSLPFFREYKDKSYRLLGLKNGDVVLDAGCGLGYDVYRMAEAVAPDGKAVGVDASAALLEKAKADGRYGTLNVAFRRADLKALPFENGYFTHSRIDRVLQHVPDPFPAVRELVRTLAGGGMLLAYDNDWTTFRIETEGHEKLSRTIEARWSGSFANPAMGAELPKLFENAGLEEITVYPMTSVFTDFETADRVYDITKTLQQLVEANQVTSDDARYWLENAKTDKTFRVTLGSAIVTGRKPTQKKE